jgi:hypothetical protein
MSKIVNARFFVAELSKKAYGGPNSESAQRDVVLQAATRGEENKSWAQYTPSGRITMTINGPAGEWFESMLGRDVAVQFTEAEEAGPTQYS